MFKINASTRYHEEYYLWVLEMKIGLRTVY